MRGERLSKEEGAKKEEGGHGSKLVWPLAEDGPESANLTPSLGFPPEACLPAHQGIRGPQQRIAVPTCIP